MTQKKLQWIIAAVCGGLLVIATVVTLTMGGGSGGGRGADSDDFSLNPFATEGDHELAQLRRMKDAMCACKDAACVDDVHWMYFPDRARSFYRVGWYDNILGADRMSLYVELGAPPGARHDVEAMRARVLDDLAAEGIVDGHRLVAWHSVVLDPAYVHVTTRSLAETARLRAELASRGVHAVGRYGGWTYCSIEDNLVETRALAAELGGTR